MRNVSSWNPKNNLLLTFSKMALRVHRNLLNLIAIRLPDEIRGNLANHEGN